MWSSGLWRGPSSLWSSQKRMNSKAISKPTLSPLPPFGIQLLLLPGRRAFSPPLHLQLSGSRTARRCGTCKCMAFTGLSLEEKFSCSVPRNTCMFHAGLETRPGHYCFWALWKWGVRPRSCGQSWVKPEDSCDKRDSRTGRRGHPRNELRVLSSGPCLPLTHLVIPHLPSPPWCGYL